MLKKTGILLAVVFTVLLSSCSMVSTAPLSAGLYTDIKYPVAVTGNSNSSKVGSADATSILGLFATGDASVEKAAKSAGITKIHHVDAQASSVLGLYAKYAVYVYGE